MPQIVDPKWEKYIRDLSIVLARHVMPLFEHKGRKPELVGSGTLVTAKGTPYLVTAAHIMDLVKSGREIFFYVETGWTQLLAGQCLMTIPPEPGNRHGDRRDLAVIKLEGRKLPPYPDIDKFSIDVSTLRRDALPRDDKEYLVVGVPSSKATAKSKTKTMFMQPYSFRNGSIPSERYHQLAIDPRINIAIGFHQRRVVGADGTYMNAPKPNGMSGSPLWLVYSDNESIDPLAPEIVGFVIEHKKTDRVMLATDAGVALDLMKHFT